MPEKVTYKRNPYPIPDLSREGVWSSRGPPVGKKIFTNDEDWDSKVKPHERLYAHHTLNSLRKNPHLYRPNVPTDHLDFILEAIYTHDKDFMVPKMYVPMQPESMNIETWRQLRNKLKVPSVKQHSKSTIPRETTFESANVSNRKSQTAGYHWAPARSVIVDATCYRGSIIEKRIHPCSVKLNIVGPHSDKSNPGYSRKIDGTHFGV